MTEPEPTAKDDEPTAKDKMREALERKNAKHHARHEARRNTGAVHGSQVDGQGKRTFRRKSG